MDHPDELGLTFTTLGILPVGSDRACAENHKSCNQLVRGQDITAMTWIEARHDRRLGGRAGDGVQGQVTCPSIVGDASQLPL
jgi:hypothetical protein